MARIEQDVAARMPADPLMEALEGGAVVQVLARVDFVAQIDSLFVAGIKNRAPASRQLVESGVDQPVRTLREREQVRPGKRAGERPHLGQAQPA